LYFEQPEVAILTRRSCSASRIVWLITRSITRRS